ncbi:class I SAM-dependent methyltransferase [Anoxynatronum buryatiense]|uniref:Methyltransferase domain-containing protein n=1 Tax=Anoxynatronum buryatiense TaxID=489973 RepID=A0AA45WX47_9CLOT|nr:class I SAM-dependent methyltransferase [Anoxynatronum buryatiense]SMP62776.1 Methyltransferase domain-containing protein [Anoxynatronum buryatiense]
MTTKDYERLLTKPTREADDQEAFWDKRAKIFHRNTKAKKSEHVVKMMEALMYRKVLKQKGEVLDIGCGTGRYAMAFAEQGQQVYASDISSEMLRYTAESCQAAGLVNVQCVKQDWSATAISELGWKNKFQLVFASMSPAIQSLKEIEKMSEASSGYCLVGRMIESKNDVETEVMQQLKLSRPYDPHNDRQIPYAMLNILWLLGYDPEIFYTEESQQVKRSVVDTIEGYAHRLKDADKATLEAIESFVSQRQVDGEIQSRSCSKMCWILWNTQQSNRA